MYKRNTQNRLLKSNLCEKSPFLKNVHVTERQNKTLKMLQNRNKTRVTPSGIKQLEGGPDFLSGSTKILIFKFDIFVTKMFK